MPLQIRRGTEFERQNMSQPLARGELLYVTDTERLFIGNGTTLGGVQITGYTNENAVDAVGAALVAGIHNGITFTYSPTQDAANRIDASVSLSDYSGVIKADAFKGTFVADDSTILVDGVSGTLRGTLVGNVTGNVTGNLSGNVTGNVNGVLTGTAGSTLNGTVTGSLLGSVTGDLKGSVFADDSTILVDGTNGVLRGTLVGNVTGNVTGNLSGTVTGNLIGNVSGNVSGDLKGSVFAEDSSVMVDATQGRFFGSIDLGDTLLSSNSLTGTSFNIGTTSDPLDQVTFTLTNNLQIRYVVDPVNGNFITTTLSRGTFGSPTAVQAGDELGGVLIRAHTSNSTTGIAGTFGFIVDPTAVISGGSFVKSKAVISASTDSSANLNDAVVIDSAGIVTSNAFVSSKYMQLAVYADDSARSAAIPTPAKGMMVFMTSGASPTVTNKTVVYDGSAWVALH